MGKRLIFACLLALTGCGAIAPSPTPVSLVELRVFLARGGVTTLSAVSGDSVCPGQALADNALHLTVTGPSTVAPSELYLYLFRAREFERTEPQVDACEGEALAAHPGETITRLDVQPYRALGISLPADLRTAVQSALREAASGG